MRSCLVVLTVIVASFVAGISSAAAPEDWTERVRAERPRMFLSAETWPAIRAYTLEHGAAYYQQLRRRVARFPLEPDESFEQGANPKFGPYAQMAAFVWLMEGDRDALTKARNYILAAPAFYHRQLDEGRAVNWYSASRICLLAAYDWIHAELSPDERAAFADAFINHHRREVESGERFERLNRGGHSTGFYGPVNLPWYIGLAFWDDEQGVPAGYARDMLERGYEQHIRLLEYRARSAGDDGGISSVSNSYGFGFYPWTEFNFMHSFNAATGLAIEEHHDHLSLLPNWVAWNWIPGVDGGKIFGLGDVQHTSNDFNEGFLEMHMLQVAHFFADTHPDRAGLAMWVRDNILTSREHDSYWWPIAPLLVTRAAELPAPQGPDEHWPHARNFETKGAIVMRSGWTPDDTHALLVAGGEINSHRHYDQGHFVIYHRGFLALDAGTYGNRRRNEHLTEYFYRSVAHNTILIHAPADADEPASVWGGPARTLDGGQYRYGGEQIAFETNDAYAYVATDMTRAYHPDKAGEVVRQFVFIYPDTFVIFDRVQARQADFNKAWLLQTARKPELLDDGRTFRTEQHEGVLMGRTVFPADARLELVGGPGREFWSAGRNWEPETSHDFHELWGEYRIEATPGQLRRRDLFLHVLRVGDESLTSLGEVEAIEEEGHLGARFEQGGRVVEIRFRPTDAPGGRIRMGEVDRPLTESVQPQSGLAVDGD